MRHIFLLLCPSLPSSIPEFFTSKLIGAKVDQLQMGLSHFDVIALCETWLSPDIQDDKIMFQNYQKPFLRGRPDDTYHVWWRNDLC